MMRGYRLVYDEEKQVLKSMKDVNLGDAVSDSITQMEF